MCAGIILLDNMKAYSELHSVEFKTSNVRKMCRTCWHQTCADSL